MTALPTIAAPRPNLNRVAVFYALTFGLAIGVSLLAPWIGQAALPLTMMTPGLGAAIMLGLLARESGWREALRGLGLTRPGLRAWPVAIAGPVAIMVAGLVMLWATGLTGIAAPEMGPLLLVDLVLSLGISSLFALGEEIGWRGYMLPRMTGLGVMTAMLAVGFLQGLWHLPLMLTTGLYHAGADPLIAVPLFLVTLTLAGVFFGALRLWTGSVWPVALAHGAVNVGWNVSTSLTQDRTLLTTEYLGGESGLFMIAGLVVVTLVVARHAGRLRPVR